MSKAISAGPFHSSNENLSKAESFLRVVKLVSVLLYQNHIRREEDGTDA